MQISARADYALRAAAVLTDTWPGLTKGEYIAQAQNIPIKFLENILLELKHAGIVLTYRGAAGGYALARPPSDITLADIIRAVDGPLANVRGQRPEVVTYTGSAQSLQEVWIAVRASLRAVLEVVTLDDLARHRLPSIVNALTSDTDAWTAH